MALTAILRSSASMAARVVVGTPWQSRHCAAFSVAKLCAARRPNMFHSVSASADKKFVETLQSEVDAVVQSDDFGKEVDVPSNFPFSLRECSISNELTLTREYQGETIKVQLSFSSYTDNHEENEEGRRSVPLDVTITKTNGRSLNFVINVLPDKIRIKRMWMWLRGGDLYHYDPNFRDLDENLEKAFLRYLEVRGINLSATNFLYQYMIEKETKAYIWWLDCVKYIVQA